MSAQPLRMMKTPTAWNPSLIFEAKPLSEQSTRWCNVAQSGAEDAVLEILGKNESMRRKELPPFEMSIQRSRSCIA